MYPGGSKKRINKAGDHVRAGTASPDDLAAIAEWRAAHRGVLNTFQAILRMRTKGSEISVAQRHKRRNTIYGKLEREDGMQLSRMDDIAGCRMIFKDIEGLYAFREKFHEARFKHKRRNDTDKYDYIKKPKSSGYRGIHDVYEYNVNSEQGRPLRGLMVEIQYRTLIQHAWATTVEVIGFITKSQPKFRQGDMRYERAMAYASEILARAHERCKGPFPFKSDEKIVAEFDRLDSELHLLQTLQGLNGSGMQSTRKRNVILVFDVGGELTVETYETATSAIAALFEMESTHPEKDIVLVRADTNEEVRLAYKNYFSDAKDFLSWIKSGRTRLLKRSRRDRAT